MHKMKAVCSKYPIRIAILALTIIQALYKSHAISNSTHLHLNVEVAPCVGPRKPRATLSKTVIKLNQSIGIMVFGSDDINGRFKAQVDVIQYFSAQEC